MGGGEHNTVSTFTGEIPSPLIQIHMNPITNKINTIKTVFKVVNPRKSGVYNLDYNEGWNDCLKESKKRQKKLIKGLEQLATHFETE